VIAGLRSGRGPRVARAAALAFGILMAAALVLALVRPALAQEQVPSPDTQVPIPDGQESLPDGDAQLPDGESPLPDSEIPGVTTQQEPPGEDDTGAAGVTCQGQPATIRGNDGDNKIDGTEEVDVIVAGDGQDEIDGKGGDDVICAGDGDAARQDDVDDDDEVQGGPGSDTINGGSGNDSIDGQGGDDTLFGDDEQTSDGYISTADEIHGGDGDDEIDGRADQDIVRGGDGDDTITSRGDGVVVGGGQGGAPQPITIIDVVIGGPGRDDCAADEDDDVSECGDEDGDDDSGTDNDGDDGNDGDGGDDDNDSSGDADAIVGAVLPPLCLAREASVGKLGMGRLFLGGNVVETLIGVGELPFPLPTRSFSFCVEGGGVTLVAFSPIGRAEVILSTGPGRSAREVNPGDPASAIRRSYPNAVRIESPAAHSGARLYRASATSRIVFGVRGGRVVFVGMASRMVLADGDLLAQYLRQIPLPPAG